MKIYPILIILCLVSYLLQAQKVIEQHLPFTTGKKVVMNIQIADSIHIISWSKNEVYAKASVNLNDNKDNDKYITSFDASGDDIRIRANIKAEKQDWHDDSDHRSYHNSVTWTVYVPDNAVFSVETINGNITIEGKTTAIKAKSISGFIDLRCSSGRKADLKMNTISGTIYTDLPLSGSGSRSGSNTVNTELNGGGDDVNLETISGDIFLRKE